MFIVSLDIFFNYNMLTKDCALVKCFKVIANKNLVEYLT